MKTFKLTWRPSAHQLTCLFLMLLLCTSSSLQASSKNLTKSTDPTDKVSFIDSKSQFEKFAFTYDTIWRFLGVRVGSDEEKIFEKCQTLNNSPPTNKTVEPITVQSPSDKDTTSTSPSVQSTIAVPGLFVMVNDDEDRWNLPAQGPHKILIEDLLEDDNLVKNLRQNKFGNQQQGLSSSSHEDDGKKINLTDTILRKRLLDTFQPILDGVVDNQHMKLTKDVYVLTENFNATTSTSINYHKLNLTTSSTNRDINQVVDHIHGDIEKKTFGTIKNRLIPRAGWYGEPFGPWTEAIFIQTFYQKSAWSIPFKSIGLKRFGSFSSEKNVTTEFLEGVGNFRYFQGPVDSEDNGGGGAGARYKMVQIPLSKGSRTSLVLIGQENSTCLQYSGEKLNLMKKLFQNGLKKFIKIQIPQFNMSSSSGHGHLLLAMGMKDTVCIQADPTPPVSKGLFGMAEYSRVDLRADFLEISSAAGTSLYDPKKLYFHIHGGSPPETSQQDSKIETKDEGIQRHDEQVKDQRVGGRRMRRSARRKSGGKGQAPHFQKDDEGKEVVRFDSAFTWILMEERVGPLFFGHVQKPQSHYDEKGREAEDLAESSFSWLGDTAKMALWGCP